MSEVQLRMSDWLTLAAAPTCMIMALATGLSDGGSLPMAHWAGMGTPLGGMTAMYLLMAAFHSPAWLRLAGRARLSDRRIADA